MSFLTPLYLAGLAAIALPVVFHLIRRTPPGRRVFSSLMFLSPTSPRVTRRSRLDNLLLLLLRAAAVTLLAIAFARPFLESLTSETTDRSYGRRVAIVVDTSASMRRSGLWARAVKEVEKTLSDLEPNDEVALFTFADRVETIVGFDSQPETPTGGKPAWIKRRLAELRPTWAHTDSGSALMAVADMLAATDEPAHGDTSAQIVLVTDLQRGSDTSSLQAYQWPKEVRVTVRQVAPNEATNAYARVLTSRDNMESLAEKDGLRVRVSNAADSNRDEFRVRWSGAPSQRPTDSEMAVYVPPGQSRVVRVARPAGETLPDRLMLTGDNCEFDNAFYVAPMQEEEITVVYVGSDAADDPDGLRYYLELALTDTPWRKVNVICPPEDQPLAFDALRPRLAVVAEPLSPKRLGQLNRYVESGGSLLMVPKTQEALVSLVSFNVDVAAKPVEPVQPAAGYVMLGEIDFTHPLFATFVSPRYNDFTKIHFWKHRHVALKDNSQARVVARFDNGAPAIWEQPCGRGTLYMLTSGWHPEDSQLALSSKFVPLLNGILDQAAGGEIEIPTYAVGQPARLPAASVAGAATIVYRPDGNESTLTDDAQAYTATDQPGMFRVRRGDESHDFAVNLSKSESDTSPMSVELLEQYGVRLGEQPTRAEQQRRERQLHRTELEARQSIWRWLIVGALCVLTLETWMAGKRLQPVPDLTGEEA